MAQPTSFVRARVRGAVDPTRLAALVERVLVRVRGALDLPSRAEMIDLTERLEQLDRRISELAAERVAELSRAAPALPAPAPAPEIETIETASEPPSEPATEAAAERRSASDQSAPERVRRGGARRASARTGKR